MARITPRIGPCLNWVTPETVLASLPTQLVKDDGIAEQATLSASDILYIASGKQFTGACGPAWVRPISRPTDIDSRAFSNQVGGWFASWGECYGYGLPTIGVVSHYQCPKPPEVDLGAYPVTEVLQVLINGEVIPGPIDEVAGTTGEWYLQDYRTLVRARPTVSYESTEMWGWPTCQDLSLPLDQPGTFGVQFNYGFSPPQAGVNAAIELARTIYLYLANQPNQLPPTAQTVVRQGITTHIKALSDYIAKGGTFGLPLVDMFIKTYNPSGLTEGATVWSPDKARPRRVPSRG